MMDVAASGGYYVALGADTIVAHPTTVTGSIGVIMVTVNAEGLMQKLGIAAGAVKSGALKDMGSPFRGLTGEERQIFQSVIDGLQDQFLARLVESRKLPMETAKRLADGRGHRNRRSISSSSTGSATAWTTRSTSRKAIGVDQAGVVVYHRPSNTARPTTRGRGRPPGSDVSISRPVGPRRRPGFLLSLVALRLAAAADASKPAQASTGAAGAPRSSSVRLRPHITNAEPRADVTMCARGRRRRASPSVTALWREIEELDDPRGGAQIVSPLCRRSRRAPHRRAPTARPAARPAR